MAKHRGRALRRRYGRSSDPHADAMSRGTAAKFQTLAALRGVAAHIMWDGAQYRANGHPCGPSVHGLYEWLDSQPGVRR